MCRFWEELFFLREDVYKRQALTDIDLGAAMEFHKNKGGIATLILTEVEDVSQYGRCV